MSKELVELMRQANALTPDEQLQLIAHLVESIGHCKIEAKPRRDVMEFMGIAPNMLGGMDAQEYVNRMRRGEFPELEIQPRKEK
ncbi:MAG: hypothetical protein GDA48_28615 [Hormoscilla sp. GM102CHS1]|nr:hypothetical protein [Hormoscilla sp. GM102CHS1]